MELSDLQIFRTVVQAGGINRAASRLNRVQSNISVRVKQLEDDLGVPLFLREGKRLALLPAGEVFLDYADRLLELAQEARDTLHDPKPRGLLRLGTIESAAGTRLPQPLSEFHRRHPGVTLELRIGQSKSLVAQVLAGEIDAALVAEPIIDSRLERLRVFEEHLVIVAEAGHPPIVSPKDVLTPTLLAFEAGCAYRQRLEDWFARHHLVPDRIVTLASYHAILGCAAVGMGIGIMPLSIIDTCPVRSSISVHELNKKERVALTALVWRKAKPQANVNALAEVLGL